LRGRRGSGRFPIYGGDGDRWAIRGDLRGLYEVGGERGFGDDQRGFVIQGVSEIGVLILTGNRTHQKEQLFSLPFWRKPLRNGLKNRKDFPKTVYISKTKLPKNVKQPDSYEVDFLVYG
jgi:hypothetical protein